MGNKPFNSYDYKNIPGGQSIPGSYEIQSPQRGTEDYDSYDATESNIQQRKINQDRVTFDSYEVKEKKPRANTLKKSYEITDINREKLEKDFKKESYDSSMQREEVDREYYDTSVQRNETDRVHYNTSIAHKEVDREYYDTSVQRKEVSHTHYDTSISREEVDREYYNTATQRDEINRAHYDASVSREEVNREYYEYDATSTKNKNYSSIEIKQPSRIIQPRRSNVILPDRRNTANRWIGDNGVAKNPYGWDPNSSSMKAVMRSNLIYDRSEIDWYRKLNRFGCLDPYNRLGITREYLFFVKPDLHIYEPWTTNLNPKLQQYPYFVDLAERYPYIVQTLQRSAGGDGQMMRQPFMTILSNAVKNTLDLEDLSAEDIETAANSWGTKVMYRKHTWSGDDNVEFGLEFEDTKYIEIYTLAKAYDQYNRLAQFGIVDPPNVDGAPVSDSGYNYNRYVKNKELHDQFGIYKFIVDEDMETIIYYAYFCGCYIKNVPRSAFSDIAQGDLLKFTLNFHAFNVDDNDPQILEDFNNLILESYGDFPGKPFPIYNDDRAMVDGDWALVPYIEKTYKSKTDPNAWHSSSGMQYKYKLKWRK